MRAIATLCWASVLMGLLGCGDAPAAEPAVDGGRSDSADTDPQTPRDECGDGLDGDEDGDIDEGCACGNSETQSCYSGDIETDRVGACRRGTQTCNAESSTEFGAWGECVGDVLPGEESCDGSTDEDCDGAVDEGCPCTAGETSPCGAPEFLEPPCRGGMQRCKPDGTWSACEGAVDPEPEVCGDGVDNDCDGEVDDESLCSCTPEPEVCGDGVDNDCDGVVDEPSACADCSPTEEVCDGTDDDCDGRIDEGTCACDSDVELCGGSAPGPAPGSFMADAAADASNAFAPSLFAVAPSGQWYAAHSEEVLRAPRLPKSRTRIFARDETGAVVWERQVRDETSGASDLITRVHDMDVDSIGNLYVLGQVQGEDEFVIEGGTNFDLGPTPGGTGWLFDYVISYAPDGTVRWRYLLPVPSTRTLPTAGQARFEELAADSDGNVYLRGAVFGPVDLGDGRAIGSGGVEQAIVSLAADGSPRWARLLPWPDTGWPRGDLVLDASGSRLAASSKYDVPIDLGDGIVHDPAPGGRGSFLVVLDAATGETQWSTAAVSDGGSYPHAFLRGLGFGPCGVHVAGQCQGELQIAGADADCTDAGGFVALVEAPGTLAWSTDHSGAFHDIAVDRAGNTHATGSSGDAGCSAGDFCGALVTYDPSGARIGRRPYPGINGATLQVGVDAEAAVMLASSYLASPIDLGGGASCPPGFCYARYSRCGG